LAVTLKKPLFFPGEYRGERRLPRTGKQWEKSITMAKMCQDKKPRCRESEIALTAGEAKKKQ